MITADTTLAPFSYPFYDPETRRSLHADLMVNAAKSRTHLFLQHHGHEIESRSSGLVAVIRNWCEFSATVAQTIQLPLVIQMPLRRQADPVWTAAQFTAGLHAEGSEGEWQATFTQEASLAFGWRQIPGSRNIAVSAHSGRIQICLDNGPTAAVTEFPEVPLMFDFGSARIPILGRQTQSVFPVDDRAGFSDVPATEVAAILSEAAGLLITYAPTYLDWIEGIISAVVPVPRPATDMFQSFSLPFVYGAIFLSFPAPVLKIAELLVHECSHQYFHVAELGTKFSNGRDQRSYYSPFVQKHRPIDRILIAFHAFANVVLFYRACLRSGKREFHKAAEREIEFNLACLRTMSADLEQSPGLTPAGRGLFEVVRDELFQ